MPLGYYWLQFPESGTPSPSPIRFLRPHGEGGRGDSGSSQERNEGRIVVRRCHSAALSFFVAGKELEGTLES